jgi:hypothetical protein
MPALSLRSHLGRRARHPVLGRSHGTGLLYGRSPPSAYKQPDNSTALLTGGVLTWAFNGYTMIPVAYPIRLRATASGFTDGLGHVGAVFGPILAGWLISIGLAALIGH